MATHASAQPRQDPTAVDPNHYTVELETDQIRVLRVKYGPYEKSRMHSHPALVAVMLTDARIRMTYPDGRSEEITAKAGEVMNMPATDHLPENTGDQTMEIVLIEMKQ